MHAFKLVGLTFFGVPGAILALGTGCDVGDAGGGSSGGEVAAAVHGLKCEQIYCDCVDRWDWSAQRCRDTYCAGGPNYHGGDAACAATAIDDPNLKCDQAYCDCIAYGLPPKQCRRNHCEGSKHYQGGDATCFGFVPDPPPPTCDPGYCDCVQGGLPDWLCRDTYCGGKEPDVVCGDVSPCQQDTGWVDGSVVQANTGWRNSHLALEEDDRFATFTVSQGCDNGGSLVGPITRDSKPLGLRNYSGLDIPDGARLTGIEARIKQSGGIVGLAIPYTPVGEAPDQATKARVEGGFHYYGGPEDLFGLPLEAQHTHMAGPWGMTMQVVVTAERGPCPISASSKVDVIQLKAHYDVCD